MSGMNCVVAASAGEGGAALDPVGRVAIDQAYAAIVPSSAPLPLRVIVLSGTVQVSAGQIASGPLGVALTKTTHSEDSPRPLVAVARSW